MMPAIQTPETHAKSAKQFSAFDSVFNFKSFAKFWKCKAVEKNSNYWLPTPNDHVWKQLYVM